MPTYQYECDSCGYNFEALQTMMESKLTKCEKCGKDSLVRLIGTGGGIIFKGNGFYETDYKKKDEPKTADKSDPTSASEKSSSAPSKDN